MRCCGAILTTAVTDELLASNPCRVRAAGNPPNKKAICPATLAELDALVKEMQDQLRGQVLHLRLVRASHGEVLELRRRDLDLNRRGVKATRAVSWVRGQPIIGAPKSSADTREVSMPPHIVPHKAAPGEASARLGAPPARVQ